jgi:hypothetical protein
VLGAFGLGTIIALYFFLFYQPPDRILLDHSQGTVRVVVWRKASAWEHDTYEYDIQFAGVTLQGPYHLGPAFWDSPRFGCEEIGDAKLIVFNRDRPDDVYIFVDLRTREIYPSPDSKLTAAEETDPLLAKEYRATARMTQLFPSP